MIEAAWGAAADRSAFSALRQPSVRCHLELGMLLIDGFAVLNLLFAWVSLQGKEPETASEGRAHAEAR